MPAEVRAEVERQLAAHPRQAIEASQHLHVHGVTLADVIAARQQDEQSAAVRADSRPAIEYGPPW